MRRRSGRGPNTSESTGKTGAEVPANQPAPLVPLYPDATPAHSPRPRHAPQPPRPQWPAKQQEWNEPPDSGRLEVETQPEMPAIATPKPNAQGQTPKGYVVLAIGMPGSGKTTWFGRRGITPLSSDLLRNILFDDVEEQRYQGLVFSTLRSLLRARLIAKMPMNYVDATNLSIHERRQWIKMAKSLLRSAGSLLRRAARSLPGAQPPARPLGKRRHHAQDGRKAQAPGLRRGLREDHCGEGEERELKICKYGSRSERHRSHECIARSTRLRFAR